MILALIGHRGVGKSSLAERLRAYAVKKNLNLPVFDLDRSIDEGEKQNLSAIFSQRGEAEFRVLEKQYLDRMLQTIEKTTVYEPEKFPYRAIISLGAGYSGELPPHLWCVWVRRPTDPNGRIFLSRPRLEPQQKPLEEYLRRFPKREEIYRKRANEILTLTEGFDFENEFEARFFNLGEKTTNAVGGCLTLLPENFKSPENFKRFIDRRLSWNLDYFEVRDDILDEAQIQQALECIPESKLLLSFRSTTTTSLHKIDLKKYLWDWPAEMGECRLGSPPVVSLHERSETPEKTLDRLEQVLRPLKAEPQIKLSIELDTLDELDFFHSWYRQNPQKRSFLPRSKTGRWSWYRLHQQKLMKLNFWREGAGSSQDQPYFMDWCRQAEFPNASNAAFAAILGDPVLHSRTPAEQASFFQSYRMPCYAIPLKEEEFSEMNLKRLQSYGLKAAAITSPLKMKAFLLSQSHTDAAQQFESVNTIAWTGENWTGHNTDYDGLQEVLTSLQLAAFQSLAVWGGGGTLSMIRSLLPQARLFSARSGQEKDVLQNEYRITKSIKDFKPQVLLWAVNRGREFQWPSSSWHPQIVLDLNYTEDSPALEYVQKVGARYVSGIKMFKGQAAAQREFWKSILK
jgi:hypothetical protein